MSLKSLCYKTMKLLLHNRQNSRRDELQCLNFSLCDITPSSFKKLLYKMSVNVLTFFCPCQNHSSMASIRQPYSRSD